MHERVAEMSDILSKIETYKRREIAESVIAGRKSGADMARLYNISQRTVSRIVARLDGPVTTPRILARYASIQRPSASMQATRSSGIVSR